MREKASFSKINTNGGFGDTESWGTEGVKTRKLEIGDLEVPGMWQLNVCQHLYLFRKQPCLCLPLLSPDRVW